MDMIILSDPVDESDIDSPVYDEQPVDDLNEYDLSGTTFYKSTSGDIKVTIRRWFLVTTEKLDSGDHQVEVEVHDQKVLNPHMHSSSGPVSATNVQVIEKEFEQPDHEPVLPWIDDEIEIWLSEWDEENPPTDLLPE